MKKLLNAQLEYLCKKILCRKTNRYKSSEFGKHHWKSRVHERKGNRIEKVK